MLVDQSPRQDSTGIDPDAQLMLQAAEDDWEAFARLVHRYRARVVTELVRWVGREHIAEELAQEVFLRVYMARKRYSPRAKFSTWLFTIVRNLGLNERRKIALRGELSGECWPECPFREGVLVRRATRLEEGPEQVAQVGELQGLVRGAVAKLSKRQRQAVVLATFRSMNHHEVAAAMQVSPEAIKSLLARARGRLRHLLQPYFRAA